MNQPMGNSPVPQNPVPPPPSAADATPPPPPTSPMQAPVFPIVVHYNYVMGIVFIVVGGLLSALAISSGEVPLALIFVFLGGLYLFGKMIVVTPTEVDVKNPLQMTLRRREINGLGDLMFKGNKLYRRSDDKKILNMGWGGARSDELKRFKDLVAGAQSAPPQF